MATPQLTVHNAEIRTATVEIKTLTVSGKQVTLAVFRQLQNAPYLDDRFQPQGDAWGRVNYCPDKRCSTGRHVHVVWQRGTDLLRSVVRHPDDVGSFQVSLVPAHWDAYRAALALPQLFIAV